MKRPDILDGSGFTRTTDPINPYEHADMKEFLRRQGASNASARAAIAKRLASLEKGRSRRIEDLGITEERGLRDISGDFEQRGLLNSGRNDRASREFGGDVERNRSRFMEDLAEQIAGVEERRSKIGSGSAEREADMATSVRRQIELERAAQRIITDIR